jgi:hypothetical protein
MTTGHYLLDRQVAHGPKWYTSRRQPILAVVEHVTAGLEDLDTLDDHSAERTAAYAATTDRKVSWHEGTDADSTISLLPDTHTAFHVAGYNSCTLGREISKRHTDWRTMPPHWTRATLANAAVADARWCRRWGIPIRKATRPDLDAAITRWRNGGPAIPVGFVAHWELDPSRRSDPGLHQGRDTFPWRSYLELVAHHVNGTPLEDPDMPAPVLALLREKPGPGAPWHCYRIDGIVASWCPTTEAIDTARYLGAVWWGGSQEHAEIDPVVWSSLAILTGPLANLRVAS